MLSPGAIEASEIAVVGRSCRLPGASSLSGLWQLLTQGRCAISQIPKDRWAQGKFWHPRRFEPGKSYTFAAGVLDDIWGFDPDVFGISPREAEQMDPQQRILLELVWEALEDAGIPPSVLSGEQVGVFVGASSLDYGNRTLFDIAAGNAHFATGNSLALVSNRISYIFDFRGPSFTIDTACSSSSVALHQAVTALQSGRIDTAVVGGINVMASPFTFISNAQASMLSPTGLCRPFDAKADGYVRAEGGVVLVLRTLAAAHSAQNPIFGLVVGSGVNSDGRTVGVSMPSANAQAQLLTLVHEQAGIDPNALAFVEAHGTGTRVGDPAEATAIGNTLARARSAPLLVGSIKSNIGHLEPAAGLAGVLKALLALEHNLLPASLHCDEPNPDIDFDGLNISVCRQSMPLPSGRQRRHAAVNSFGFGGTNAHVVVADPPQRVSASANGNGGAGVLLISAQSSAALATLASDYASRLTDRSNGSAGPIVLAAAYHRERLPQRLAVTAATVTEAVEVLRNFPHDSENHDFVAGTAVARDAPVAFVYSGNGSQWPGMGRLAYNESHDFALAMDEIDRRFAKLAGWSVRAALFDDALGERLALTKIAQPLIFAIQYAATAALRSIGVNPVVVLGHSVGEIAAAQAVGVLALEDALRVIYFRSLHQERAHNLGRMAVLISSHAVAEQMVRDIPDLEIAAFNSARAFTLSGTTEAINSIADKAEAENLQLHRLDLDYPFHSQLMDGVQQPLLRDLQSVFPQSGHTAFASTVTGGVIDGRQLDAAYWWRNVREPVQFAKAVQAASVAGARVFLEIGPRMMLGSHLTATLDSTKHPFAVLGSLDKRAEAGDPFRHAAATAWANGAAIDLGKLVGPDPGLPPDLPRCAWDRRQFRLGLTCEGASTLEAQFWHPLIGSRTSADGIEWRAHVDPLLVPELADHKINGQVLLPAAALVEMALAATREWLRSDGACVVDLDLIRPMTFADGVSREVSTRISPASGTVEIFSRPRLSQIPWLLHAVAKIVRQPQSLEPGKPWDAESAESVPADSLYSISLYSIADQVGLQFGPVFRQLERATRFPNGKIAVDLAPPPDGTVYGLDPPRLDSCFHGLIVLFTELSLQQTPFLPVKFGDIRLFKPGRAPTRALIEVSLANETAICADFILLDGEGEIVASLGNARFQAMRVRPAGDLLTNALVQSSRRMVSSARRNATISLSATEIAERANRLATAPEEKSASEAALLLEAWATAAALSYVAALADQDKIVDLQKLFGSQHRPEARSAWISTLLDWLARTDLAVNDGHWRITPDVDFPPDATILRTLAAEHPDRSIELLLASRLSCLLQQAKSDPQVLTDASISPILLDTLQHGGAWMARATEFLSTLFRQVLPDLSSHGGLRILQVGFGPLAHPLAVLARAYDAGLTILETDPQRLEWAKLAFGSDHDIAIPDDSAPLPAGCFDIAVVVGSTFGLGSPDETLSRLAKALCRDGLLLGCEPMPSLFADLVFGLQSDWFETLAGIKPGGRLRTVDGWRRSLERAEFADPLVRHIKLNGEDVTFFVATNASAASADADPESRSVLIVAAGGASGIADRLNARFAAKGHRSLVHCGPMTASAFPPDVQPDVIIHIGAAFDQAGAPSESLRERCLELKGCIESLKQAKPKLWVVTRGAYGDSFAPASAIEAGYSAFIGTVANEFPNLDIRHADLSTGLPEAAAAERIVDLVSHSGDETEVLLGAHDDRVLRVEHLKPLVEEQTSVETTTRLERGLSGGLGGLRWVHVERKPPGQDEIEIEVEATGLNFRDVMWALSVLPDDILEGGYAGPCLGLECSGRVARVGPGVQSLKVGDRVVAFASSAFSTHIVVPAMLAATLPQRMSCEAAASIPIAFTTAYYALVKLAHIEQGEWILIHGAAGGVGLAALQIAQWHGARVIATAGSEEKRDLLRILGADHVLDSRSLKFVDELRRICPAGVDIVLNSLSGEAMERGLGVLKPFGRFLELGKRDYVANTHIGLRPLRNNLAYFGIDLDQLVRDRPAVFADIAKEIVRLMGEGSLYPLPYRRYAAHDVVEAFRLMQQSGHIGKIVVAPPQRQAAPRRSERQYQLNPDRAYLITGGFSGFGREAARWLAQRGARHLVLVGRRGSTTPEAQELLAEMAERGVSVMAEACDVADRAALGAIFRKMDAQLPALGGVVHSAMVLDDATLRNIDAERLDKVLRPKVLGAENLDWLTRERPIDFFVLFSSATTILGSTGQGSYVAANGYLEGLARRRRQQGLPALAIAWGAISDTGVLANRADREALASRIGVIAMTARGALDLMGETLARAAAAAPPEEAVIAIAPMDWSIARERLKILRSPTYAALVQGKRNAERAEHSQLDVRQLIESEGIEAARKAIQELIVDEVARVLRMPKEHVNTLRPLSEVGLDSLMAVELEMSLQERVGKETSLTAAASGLTVADLAQQILRVGSADGTES